MCVCAWLLFSRGWGHSTSAGDPRLKDTWVGPDFCHHWPCMALGKSDLLRASVL